MFNIREEIEMLITRMESQKSLFERTIKNQKDESVALFCKARIEENDHWRKELEKIISE